MSISYAVLGTTINIGGQASIKQTEPIRITAVQPSSSQPACASATYPPTWSDTAFQVDGALTALDCKLIFDLKIKNETNDMVYIKQILEDSFNNSANMQYSFSFTLNTPSSVIAAQSEQQFSLTLSYKPSLSSLPALTSFMASFRLVIDVVTPPILVVNNSARNFEIFRGETSFTPANLTSRLSALDDIEGNITNQITRTCRKGNVNIACPSSWLDWDAGNYTITYNVSNLFGLAATPVTMHIENWQFIKIASGQYHGIALGSNGSVWTWGYNNRGQRGIGVNGLANTINSGSPSLISKNEFGDQRIIDIAGAHNTSCAVAANGRAYCWGSDDGGALGNGGSNGDTNSPSAVAMPSGITFKQISGSHGTSSDATFGALGSDGNVYTWGTGSSYRLGTGSTNNATTPTRITSSGDIVQVSQGNIGGSAVTVSGEVYVWGANGQGQLARGNITASNATTSKPSLVSGLSGVKQVSYGGYGGSGFIVSCKTDGTAYAWGWAWGVRGNIPSTEVSKPLQIAGLSGVRFVTAGVDYAHYVVGNDVWSVGYSNYGETFTGTATRITPIKSTLNNVTGNVGTTSGGWDNAYILNATGTMVYSIGYNNGNDRELGSSITSTISTGAVVPWTPTITMLEW
jgi:alpha-tubulin suppressor-like RCC1 family protein